MQNSLCRLQSPLARPFCRRRRFTLIELLVVIAIIAILAAMLLPALGKARAKAQENKCRGQLKDIGLSIQMYMNDSNDFFPPGMTTSSSPWRPLLDGKYIATRKIWDCPSDITRTGQTSGYTQGNYYPYSWVDKTNRSYVLERTLGQYNYANYFGLYVGSKEKQPSRVAMAADWYTQAGGQDFFYGYEAIVSFKWRAGEHHAGKANLLAGDGHVVTEYAAQLFLAGSSSLKSSHTHAYPLRTTP